MSSIEAPTHTLKFQVDADDLDNHKRSGDSIQRFLSTDLDLDVSTPHRDAGSNVLITHGDTFPWKNYGRLKSAKLNKEGPYESNYKNGYLDSSSWGDQGKKHSEIFSMGITGSDGKQLWLPTAASGGTTGITGFGFEALRMRADSASYTNSNCQNWMPFVRRAGARFVHRTSGDYRFYSSGQYATDGLPLSKFGSPTVSGKTWALYEFYQIRNWGSNSNPWTDGEDWLLESLWWNITNRDIAGTGTARGYIYIYNLRFYSNFGTETLSVPSGSQRIIRPAEQPKADRNICTIGG